MTTWFLKFSSTSQQSCGFQGRLGCLADRNIMFYSYPLFFFPFVSAVPVISRTARGGRQDAWCLICSTTGRWAEMCFQNGGSWCAFLLCELVIGRRSVGMYVMHHTQPSVMHHVCLWCFPWITSQNGSFSQFPSFPILGGHVGFVQHV